MPLFRIKPFRILVLIAMFLASADVAVTATTGGKAQPTAQHVVFSGAQLGDPSPFTELRSIKLRASRSYPRTPLPQAHPQVVHATCWNGKVVVDHPHVQDCPNRPETVAATPTYSSSAEAWAQTWKAIHVANCESGGTQQGDHYDGNPHVIASSGHYGKWQFAMSTWASVGGVGNPAYATETEQDYRAWRLWSRDGWSPWQCI